MNKSELHTLITHPEDLNKGHLGSLRSVAADFPYYQGVQALIARTLANEKHYELDTQLKKTALTVPDRNVLYRYLHNLETQERTADTVPVIEKAPEPVKEEPAALVTDPETARESILPAETEAPAEIITEALTEPVISEPVITPEEVKAPEIPADIPEPVAVVPEPAEPAMPLMNEKASSETHSFVEWLQMSKNLPAPAPEKVSTPEAAPAAEEIISPVPVAKEQIIPEKPESVAPKTVKEKSNVNDFESILDKFIRESPSISRPKAEFFNPANIARQGTEEDEDLVTETLANIYYKQGHYKKAIRAYEKLCLVYPHKMAYFADLIQKIKQETKD